MPDRQTRSPEFFCPSVAPPALGVNGTDMDHQDVILFFAGTDRASSLGPATPVADTKQAADPFA
ncbi:MAG: hypothetical protein LKI03_07570 [Acetobacter indonesiensis]|nr:hypothetical protein [Acetobacter indonesiensis]MCI1546607.1 hypothetical protein [Acetobacter indonesiensis]MCI1765892.1 hypothetical protein [Acetobacter indonesiensis]